MQDFLLALGKLGGEVKFFNLLRKHLHSIYFYFSSPSFCSLSLFFILSSLCLPPLLPPSGKEEEQGEGEGGGGEEME